MIFKFRLLSSEKDDFVRDFEVRSNQNFYDLHMAIQKNCGYDDSQIASFFLCTNDWEKETEITLFELSEELGKGILAMNNSILSDHITGLKQRLLYIFDIFNERAFFIEVVGIKDEDSSKSYPRCTLSAGSSPVQVLPDEPIPKKEQNDQWNEPGTQDMNDSDAEDTFKGNDEPIEE
jgi:hypothetical protein